MRLPLPLPLLVYLIIGPVKRQGRLEAPIKRPLRFKGHPFQGLFFLAVLMTLSVYDAVRLRLPLSLPLLVILIVCPLKRQGRLEVSIKRLPEGFTRRDHP